MASLNEKARVRLRRELKARNRVRRAKVKERQARYERSYKMRSRSAGAISVEW